ncbi:11407_t:CDS:2 [Dentiscutata erythropus]|uniref:11407_t:CDS:1 n=1 Tax=Dentiscutata erythropus TaxID=1348616 RepID=A0A9N9CLN9_9GLOM|nr:11407_t:CDS:2 [Dentiscutata erythropus]
MDEFCERMKQWSRDDGDPIRHAFSLGQLLLREDPNSRDADGTTRGIFLIGDQSASKSTTVNSIIKQVALQMGGNTVTKIRTWIEHRYDPDLEDAEYDLLLEYDAPENNEVLFRNGNLQDLTSEFTRLNNSSLDDKKEARIIIRSNVPSFAIDCCDNPGLTPKNIETQKITDNITRHTLEKVLERQKSQNDSIVLLCISAKFIENLSWTRHIELIEKINGENLIILVTRMDQINVSGIAQEIRDRILTGGDFVRPGKIDNNSNKSKGKKSNNNLTNSEPIRCSSWNILEFIRSKIEQLAERNFSNGVQFHYTASSSENWETLLEHGWKKFEESERKNNKDMIEILCDKDEWNKYGIELIPMNDREKMEFENSVGMMKLQEKLLQALHVHILKAAEDLMNYTSEWKSNKITELNSLLKDIKSTKDRSKLITSFCKQFIVVFQTLFASPLYTPTIHSDPWLKKFGDSIKMARESSVEYGWSLKDMWTIFETLKGTNGFAEFPPQEFCDSDFQYYMDNIENYINPADIHFNTAQMLIQRLSQEYTLRSSLISLQKLDVDKFVSRQVQASTATQLSFGPAVDQKISEDYGKIFCIYEKHEKKNINKVSGNSIKMRGGNQWVSVFGAMCLLLHAEYTIHIMRDTDFSLLLQSQSDDPMQGILISRFKRYWELSAEEESSAEQQSTERQIANIMDSMQKLNSETSETPNLATVSPIEDISWAIYAMFFENPYLHLKKTLDVRTDLLVMTHATSLVHCYQLGGICVHRDEDYLMKWAADNPNSAYSRAFLVDSPKNRLYLNLMIENLKMFQRGKKDKESQTNSEGETRKKPLIFSTLSETMIDRVRFSLRGKPPDREDMVTLFKELTDMGKNPDSFDEPESKTSFSEKEENSVDYVYRRRLTMGISSSITDVIQQLAKIQYEFSHQQTAETLKRELLGRVASLLLGYKYPYHPDYRPSSKWYLSPEVVIRFLLANESVFENMSESNEYKWKLLLDPRILESPLVKRVISLSKSPDYSLKNLTNGSNFMSVSYHIKRLYMAESDELDAYIIEFLANDRFNWLPDEENLKKREKDLRDAIYKYNKFHHYLKEYKNAAEAVFLGKQKDFVPNLMFDEGEAIAEINGFN